MSDLKSRRDSRMNWTIEDVDVYIIGNGEENSTNSVETHDQQQQQPETAEQNPQKIVLRRRSQRLSQKRLADANNRIQGDKQTQSDANEPPTKKKRGRPTKSNKLAKPVSSSASVQNVDDIIVLKTKNVLSEAIFGLYEYFQQDAKYSNRFSAKCTICDEEENIRISFLKGINSNLKSHLERVSIIIFLFLFISIYLDLFKLDHFVQKNNYCLLP